MRPFIAALVVLGTFCQAQAEDFTLENDVVRLAVGGDGLVKGLVEKSTGAEWLSKRPSRLAWIRKDGQIHQATAVTRRDDLLQVTFGTSGVTADLRVTARPRYFVFELAALSDEAVEELCPLQIDCRITENYGGWSDVRWNDQFAVSIIGLSDRVNTGGIRAILYPEFGLVGEKAALVAVPKDRFLDVVQEVERDNGLPCATIGGVWAKRSPDVRRGYLFTDLTEANVDETIRHAKLGEFGYIMTYSGTWSTSLGSYPINTKNFPDGEASLKRTIDKCHAAGLKVGMHMLTSFVHKHDPLVRPKPDARLLKDAASTLAADLDAKGTEIAAAPLDDFPSQAAYYGSSRQGFDVVIDDEIIHYHGLQTGDHPKLTECLRGYAGTIAAPHKAGAKIQHLAQRYGCYLVDLRTSLKDELAERIAGVVNRCGFDMIYFDGGECNSANGPAWYWVGQQQAAVWSRIERDFFVQGSGGTAWTWHFFSRGACDDFAAIAPKEYLDYHKIADSWRHYTQSFMPAELGWWGFLDDTPDHPATSPDEVEFYAVRMLALDTPVSLETSLDKLNKNGRTEELLQLLSRYERLRLGNRVSPETREKLRQGEWHMTGAGDKPTFRPVRYDDYRAETPGEIAVQNKFAAQPLAFRLKAVPTLAEVGKPGNVVLLRSEEGVQLKQPDAKTPMPGALAGRVDFGRPEGEQTSVFLVGANTEMPRGRVDLVKNRALAIKLRVDGPAPKPGEPCPVLNVQLEAGAETYRDHYIDLNFTGQRTIIMPGPNPERMLPEFRPAPAAYHFKAAGYHFNYSQIVALNFRWMRMPQTAAPQCRVSLVEALAESDTVIKNPELAVGDARLALPIELKTGDYAEYWGPGMMRVFDRNGTLLSTVDLPAAPPTLAAGPNRIKLTTASGGPARLTLITLGPGIDAW